MFRINAVLAPVLCMVLLSAGCTHSLEVKNLGKYSATTANTLKKPLSVGLRVAGEPDRRLVLGIAEQLNRYQAKVTMPFIGDPKEVDVVATVTIDSDYEGSGWNFLINFPGFLIFAPIWNGYVYEVSHKINVRLARGADGQVLGNVSIPVVLDVRHADINRTWTEISWLEVGAIALIGGLVFIDYDDHVTPILADKVAAPIGNYVAQEIVNRLNAAYAEPPRSASPEGAAAPTTAGKAKDASEATGNR